MMPNQDSTDELVTSPDPQVYLQTLWQAQKMSMGVGGILDMMAQWGADRQYVVR